MENLETVTTVTETAESVTEFSEFWYFEGMDIFPNTYNNELYEMLYNQERLLEKLEKLEALGTIESGIEQINLYTWSINMGVIWLSGLLGLAVGILIARFLKR